jgi:hypothetical protein
MANQVANSKIGMPRLDYAPNARAKQRLPECLIGIQARSHIGVDRHDDRLNKNLSLGSVRHRGVHKGKVLETWNATWPAREMNLAGLGHNFS